jgi:hypothetical protein
LPKAIFIGENTVSQDNIIIFYIGK